MRPNFLVIVNHDVQSDAGERDATATSAAADADWQSRDHVRQ
ncbi:MAG: hypothetical protein AVDCRST_MAG77-2735 [uncultured Chloroflexi bacterium]|uniref:Uncharacterized protein n=1 Tax=uncultured Chloroflexota bacterium TaxID=166587 RepID=A0A6J4IYI0_9CHLR|nr:MAG: hypothetical protein AVDCRST_MAG77-2735 [uncultured Chloroflexota bacterium]